VDGRILVAAVALVLPAVLIAVTVLEFSSNPLSLMTLAVVMLGGGLYLATYEAAETA
jgi:hypothetical protein